MRLILAPLLLLLTSCTNTAPASTSHAAPSVELDGRRFSVEFATDEAGIQPYLWEAPP